MTETTTAPRFKTKYDEVVAPALQEQFGYKNVMQMPRITKVVVNMGVGDAAKDSKLIDGAVRDLTAITGQKPIMTAKQARFQIVDVIASMRPLTKMTRQILSAASIPAVVRDAFRVATEERPGPVHLELPEDVAAETAALTRTQVLQQAL